MKIKRIEYTIIPTANKVGELYAEEYEKKLRMQGVFRKKEIQADKITLIAEYLISIKRGDS